MKILYITHFSVNDINACSGTIYHIKNMLNKMGNEVLVLDNLNLSKFYKGFVKGVTKLKGKKKTLVEREPYILKQFANEIKKKTKNLDYDIVFAPSSLYFTFYKDIKPMVFYTDATFGGMVDYYIYKNDYIKRAINNGFKQETMAIQNTDLIIYASEWAKKTAIEFHNAQSEKCIVINRGANIKHSYSNAEIHKIIEKRHLSRGLRDCRFMFLGTDWNRKGGPLACEIVRIINESYGVEAKLYVIGCKPELSEKYRKYVEVIGFINKGIASEYELLENIFRQSDFFLLPTRQEAQGISYTEACSWGLPVIGTNTGGVSGIIKHEINGIIYNLEDKPEKYAQKIISYIDDSNSYKKLAESTYRYFQENLTWEAVGMKINRVLKDLYEKDREVSNV